MEFSAPSIGWVWIFSRTALLFQRNDCITGLNLPLNIKCSMLSLDRGGLGRDMLLKRQREVKEALKHETARKRVKIEQNQRDSFRRHMSGKFAERQTSSDLYKSQKACEQLDKSKVNPCSFMSNKLLTIIIFETSSNIDTALVSSTPPIRPLCHEESTQMMAGVDLG